MIGRMRLAGLCALALLCVSGGTRGESPASPSGALVANYLRYLLLNHVNAQGADIIAQAPAALQADLRARLDGWRSSFQETIRTDLEQSLGANARPLFEEFIDTFTHAEQAKDLVYLEQLGSQVGWSGPATSGFEVFRRWGIQQWMSSDMQAGVDLLGEMGAQAEAMAQKPAVSPSPPRLANPLRDAESAAPPLEAGEVSNGAPLRQFSGLREERREKAQEQAQAGMEQVAAEREAWEQEYASDVEAKAQVEAEAMKSQAERLAATDEEALEQRKNSLKSKFVSVLAGVASSTVSGFTGAVGGRAADEAVRAIFDDKD